LRDAMLMLTFLIFRCAERHTPLLDFEPRCRRYFHADTPLAASLIIDAFVRY
jgi:hypothetical protein